MLTESQAANLVSKVLASAKGRCSGCEVIVTSSDVATSRFANNSMTQNQAPALTSVSVRVIKNGRQVRQSTSNLSAGGLKALVDKAIISCDSLQPDPDIQPLPSKGRAGKIILPNRFNRKTALMGADSRAEAVSEIIAVAKERGLNAAGVVETGGTLTAIGNSKGLFRCHRESHAECSITMKNGDSTGWSKSDRINFADLNCRALALRAADKAIANVNPVALEPGKYTVILEPSAVLDLLAYLWPDFSATSHIDKMSCLRDKVGQKVFGSNISIFDDVYHSEQAGDPFDGEGLPRQAVTLVRNGIVENMVLGRRSARKLNRESTGHGLAEPNSSGENAVNIVVAGGDTPLEKMIASSERAILLTRVWYVREVDPTAKIITGMTRDGTFLVENGVIKNAVKNLRFNQSILDTLNNVLALSPSQRTAGEEGIPAVVPAMLVQNFNFASTTTF